MLFVIDVLENFSPEGQNLVLITTLQAKPPGTSAMEEKQ